MGKLTKALEFCALQDMLPRLSAVANTIIRVIVMVQSLSLSSSLTGLRLVGTESGGLLVSVMGANLS